MPGCPVDDAVVHREAAARLATVAVGDDDDFMTPPSADCSISSSLCSNVPPLSTSSYKKDQLKT